MKLSFSIALIGAKSRWIPASTRTNQGSEKGGLVNQEDDRALSGHLSMLWGGVGGIKSSFSIALIRTKGRWIPASTLYT